VILNAETREVINRYLADISKTANIELLDRKDRQGLGEIKIVGIKCLDSEGNIAKSLISGQEVIIRMKYKSFSNRVFRKCRVSVTVTKNEQVYFCLSTDFVDTKQLDLSGEGYIDFIIPELPLSQSDYIIHSYIETNNEIQDWVTGAAEMSVADGDFYGTGKSYPPGWKGGTGLLIRYTWTQGKGSLSPSHTRQKGLF
jgi:lipopolysaccharide transport system ATP-binding protein